MTIQSENFTPIAADSLLADEPITSEGFAVLAENLHVLYALLRGEDIPGAACPIAPHDHDSQGGPPIPFVQMQSVGHPAVARVRGSETHLSFRRLSGGVAAGLDLQRSPLPDPLVSALADSTRSLLRLSGDVTAKLAGRDYVTLDDGLNRGRYLVKSVSYVSSINATSVYLWDSLASIPAPGTAVKGWNCPGDTELHLRVPRWAKNLTLFIPLCATLSLSTASGERLLSTEAGEDSLWTQALRLRCGAHAGQWVSFYPNGRRELVRQHLRMDCSALADDAIHTFRVEQVCNEAMLQRLPVAVTVDDCALWMRLSLAPPRPQVFAVFSR